ncbi:MAG: hypothetical protein FWG88_08400 [Oscillospiraceae bacterium]|nr:hypothetical protein [Oscillospiraceae bacterium]
MRANKDKNHTLAILLFFTILLFLTGCLRVTADDLYSLPQVSQDYLRLSEQINIILSQGAEFSPPTNGQNRQAVQLKDINGNGVNEVLAFFAIPGESTLSLYIFEMMDGDYTVVEIIEVVGDAFESVRYSDLDGDGEVEIILGWQMGPTLKYFSIFTVKEFRAVLLMREEFSEITLCDLTGNGNDDVIALRLPSQDTAALVQIYTLMPDGEILNSEARLSAGVEAFAKIQAGMLSDNVNALFVESEGRFDHGNLVTDIFAFQNDMFTNISLTGAGGVSEGTVRARNIYSADINDDGVFKFPIPRLLKAQSDTPYYVMDWFSMDSSGDFDLALTTYHNSFDEWYLILPPNWREKVSVRRENIVSGERTVIFSFIANEDGPYVDFLKIHRLSGDIDEEREVSKGRVILTSEGLSTYAFELLAAPNSHGLDFSEELIRANFRLIYTEWTN